MSTLKENEATATERNNFMFYETYKDTIDVIRKQDPVAAGKLCMAIIRLGVRREWTEDLPPEHRAFLKSIAPYMKRSKEKMEQKVKEARWEKYRKFQENKASSGASTSQKKTPKNSDSHDPAP